MVETVFIWLHVQPLTALVSPARFVICADLLPDRPPILLSTEAPKKVVGPPNQLYFETCENVPF